MRKSQYLCGGLAASLVLPLAFLVSAPVAAQSFRVQCPTATTLHPLVGGQPNRGIKCQQISGGDGYATMADGTQTYLFAFGPLSGIADIMNGLPGTQLPGVFNTVAGPLDLAPGAPVDTTFTYNGAVGLVRDVETVATAVAAMTLATGAGTGEVLGITVTNGGAGYTSVPSVTIESNGSGAAAVATVVNGAVTRITVTNPGSGYNFEPAVTVSPPPNMLTGKVDPRPIMDVGVMNGNFPAPMMAIDEDDEFFLTLTNVGMIMRPDLFEQHTVHFHGYPNASSFYDGVPDASVAINIGGSMTYYYLSPEAGTYFWHCHITPPEHLQMGMVGQIYVRPRQNQVPFGGSLYAALNAKELPTADPRTRCGTDILCAAPVPPTNTATRKNNKNNSPTLYAYNDGDGSTAYDVEYPIQIHGFDPNFHFVGMTFNPEPFTDQKDKYFLLNGRSYPDTMTPGPMSTPSADGVMRMSQPLSTIVNIPVGGRALLRLSSLDTMEHQTLGSLGIPMTVIALNARLLRDMAGNNMIYQSNSITLGGGESVDVILDASDAAKYPAGSTFYLYTPNLDHLSNGAENFGGLMTEVRICASVDPTTKVGTGCN